MAEVTGSSPVSPTRIFQSINKEILLIVSNRDRSAPKPPSAHRVNEQIKVSPVRLIGPDGEQVGIVEINKALDMAAENELDLVEIAPNAKPPVVRILDYGKFLYELAKKEKASRKKGHQTQIKRIRVTPKIDDHDFNFKLKAVRDFIEKGDKVKVTMIFKGRMITHKELGRDVMDRFIEAVEDIAKIEGTIQMEGQRNMVMTLQKK